MDDDQLLCSYTPDFSDMFNDQSTFWDFLPSERKQMEMTPVESNLQVPFWDFIGSESSTKTQTENSLRNKLEDCSVTGKNSLESLNTKAHISQTRESNDVSALHDSNNSTCKYQSFKTEDEDEFWDFLKSDGPINSNGDVNRGNLKVRAELEEIRKLSYLTSLSMDEVSTTSESSRFSIPYEAKRSENYIEKTLSKYRESDNLSELESLLSETSCIYKEKYCFTEKEDLGQTLQTKDSQNTTDLNSSKSVNVHTAVADVTVNISVEAKNTKPILYPSPVSKKQDAEMNFSRQHDVLQNVQPATKYDTSQTQAAQNLIPEMSLKLADKEHNNSEIILPVISSFCSISSCPDILNQVGEFTNDQNNSQFYVDDDRSGKSDATGLKNTISCNNSSATKEIVPPYQSNANFETDTNPNTESNISINVEGTPTKQRKTKNVKRLSRSSPKNSVFRITDCDPIVNVKRTVESTAANNVTDCKRLKTCDLGNNLNTVPQEYFLQNSFSEYPQIQPKTVQMLPNTENKNITTSNSTPFYLIIPNNDNSSQNQNAEFIMIINNNGTVPNNSVTKAPINEISYTFPTTCAARTMDTQMSNSNLQINGNGLQTKLPVLNVLNLDQSNQISSSSSHMQPMIVCEPIVQQMNKDERNQNLLNNTLANEIPIFPNGLSGSVSQGNNLNIYTTSVIPTNNNITSISQMNYTPITAANHLQLSKLYSKESSYEIPRTTSYDILTNNQIPHFISQTPMALQSSKSKKQEKLKPISSISIGKDKDAIQQISVPLKLESLTDPKSIHYNRGICTYNSCFADTTFNNQTGVNKIIAVQDNLTNIKQQKNYYKSSKVFDFVPYKPNTDSVLIKRNIITNTSELVSKDTFFKTQPSKLNAVQSSAFSGFNRSVTPNSLSLNKGAELCNKSSEDKLIVNVSKNDISKYIIQVNPTVTQQSNLVQGKNTTNESHILEAPKSIYTIPTYTKSEVQSLPSSNSIQTKTALATFQEIFPPPISMIPVCVMQPGQNANKPTVSKVMILQSKNAILPVNNQTHITSCNAKNKTYIKKTTTKLKKVGRKTVRQLLEEKHKTAESDKINNIYQTRSVTKVSKFMNRLAENNVLMSTEMPDNFSILRNKDVTEVIKDIDVCTSSSKRPNILILPSATRIDQSNTLQEGAREREISAKEYSRFSEPRTVYVPPDASSYDFLMTEKPAAFKDYRPRYYDISELSIGYFKVADDFDSSGKSHCKLKVLFTKRQFIYDFSAAKCNQVDVTGAGTWEQMIRILVPFKTVEAISMIDRSINIKVDSCPEIFLWKMQRRSGLEVASKKGFNTPADSSMWIDAVRNSLLHKIMLRKRQADNLKTNLCLFDEKFLAIFNAGAKLDISVLDESPFEEEFAPTSLRKFYKKNKKNCTRRLPQWDSDQLFEYTVPNDNNRTSSSHVCSCRISCKSMRCSCVKAAKSCSTVGALCLCTGCDNPLNVLEFLGLNLDFSLSDCCLFQNIYEIPRLQTFLQRDVKLSCCNTTARVLDCIPGTILCPNTECNACLEFSWCRGIVCYPERNPRNHCSYCGMCCFSNGRHCHVCNKCYVVTPKCPQCPNCETDFLSMNRIRQDTDLGFLTTLLAPAEEAYTKTGTKPEIILLDSSFSMKPEELSLEKKISTTEEIKDDNYSVQNNKKESPEASDQKIPIKADVCSQEHKENITTLKVEDSIEDHARILPDNSKINVTVDKGTAQIKCEDSTTEGISGTDVKPDIAPLTMEMEAVVSETQ